MVLKAIRRLSYVAFIAAATFCFLSSTKAAVFDITYTGTVSTGVDQGGLFGSANSSLAGDPFTMVYTFDTSKGFFDINPSTHPWATQLYGGPGETGNYPSPGFATLTINGISVTLNGNQSSQTENTNYPGQYGVIYTSTSNLDPGAYISYSSTAMYWQRNYLDPTETTIPVLVGTPLSLVAGPNDSFTGPFELFTGENVPLASGNLDATTLTV